MGSLSAALSQNCPTEMVIKDQILCSLIVLYFVGRANLTSRFIS